MPKFRSGSVAGKIAGQEVVNSRVLCSTVVALQDMHKHKYASGNVFDPPQGLSPQEHDETTGREELWPLETDSSGERGGVCSRIWPDVVNATSRR
jgi:hypothetical protein